MKYYLGIDIGTSSTKAICFNRDGQAVGEASADYPLYHPHPGYAEQNPEDWFSAVISVIREITSQGFDISGIGLSGQMHGLVLLDQNDRVLRNSIIWCDNRSIFEQREVERVFGKQKMKEITGNEPVAAFTLCKLLWVKHHEEEIYKQIAKVCLPKDYIRYRLTKVFQTEYSDASGMQLLDLRRKEFSQEILNAFQIPIRWLPELIESQEKSGLICPEIAKITGLKETCFVVGGAGDQAAAAIGAGIVSPQDASIVLGSSGVVFTPVEEKDLQDTKVQVFMHAVPNRYHMMGVTNGCGLSYKWLKENVFDASYDQLNEEAETSSAGSHGVFYLPYLNGERTPHLDPYCTGTFVGIRQSTERKDVIRSVLEGVAYSLKDCFSLLPSSKKTIRIGGGGAKGTLWRKIIASVLNVPVERIVQEEGGALGVAILAMVADGQYASVEEACKQIIVTKDVVLPDENWVSVYQKNYVFYKKIYLQLKETYQEIFESQEKEI